MAPLPAQLGATASALLALGSLSVSLAATASTATYANDATFAAQTGSALLRRRPPQAPALAAGSPIALSARHEMLMAMNRNDPHPMHVACLCAAWCRLCDDYGPLFTQALATFHEQQPRLRPHWIDIEDEAELVDELDVETFPTIVVFDDHHVWFAGPLTPQPETLRRVLRVALAAAASGATPAAQPPEVHALAQRLRQRVA
jgi:hypothetical protein